MANKDLNLDLSRSDVFLDNRPGAPEKDKDMRLAKVKKVAFTEGEYESIVKHLKAKGFSSFSAFVRDSILRNIQYYES